MEERRVALNSAIIDGLPPERQPSAGGYALARKRYSTEGSRGAGRACYRAWSPSIIRSASCVFASEGHLTQDANNASTSRRGRSRGLREGGGNDDSRK